MCDPRGSGMPLNVQIKKGLGRCWTEAEPGEREGRYFSGCFLIICFLALFSIPNG